MLRNSRGAVGKGCLIALAVVVALAVIIGVLFSGNYNRFVSGQEGIEAAWSEIDNQYKRRFDLIPSLVETVKGAADFEKSTLREVTEARASVGKMQLPSNLPTDPAQLNEFMNAQNSLGGALGRLMVVVERYPELKANQSFLSLQDQLEGTENRIAVARRDYIDTVKNYNTSIRKFPGNLVAEMFGFERAAQIEAATEEERQRPEVNFGSDE
ncbi:hypothetical protein ABI59_13475 [Acidobacteria bacterium Mor1]|nr:hypothetical protein ABI59_13475 [Acidobacteria bacterium Mor1]